MPKFDGWRVTYMDNHDSGRPEYRKYAAKMLATYLGTLSGTLKSTWPTSNAGDVDSGGLHRRRGAQLLQQRPGAARRGRGHEGCAARDAPEGEEQRAAADAKGCREARGFTAAEKRWMRVDDDMDFAEWNIEKQESDADSVLSYWRNVLAVRKGEQDVSVYGQCEILPVKRREDGFAYRMTSFDDRTALVMLNFSDQGFKTVCLRGVALGDGRAAGVSKTAALGRPWVVLKPYSKV
ncbi:Glycoside hydrolase family 13 [Tolypocladium paradoxum]|uniref:Glycoside hydrolase family 13 n=1 Tax=Tolypocladium paradoxum TaxID=94208 RepID=A0A2S4L7B1_9HYPO|nr:Glycoside hydrolase family 13 [Tolypocladium paradoxum]